MADIRSFARQGLRIGWGASLRLVHSGHLDLSDFMEVNGRFERWDSVPLEQHAAQQKKLQVVLRNMNFEEIRC